MFWIALELSIPKIGFNITLSLPVKKLDAFKFDGVAESDNTGIMYLALHLCYYSFAITPFGLAEKGETQGKENAAFKIYSAQGYFRELFFGPNPIFISAIGLINSLRGIRQKVLAEESKSPHTDATTFHRKTRNKHEST